MARPLPLLLLIVSLPCLPAAEDAGDEADPALGVRARLEQDVGADSNPTKADPRNRSSAESADDFARTDASLRLALSAWW